MAKLLQIGGLLGAGLVLGALAGGGPAWGASAQAKWGPFSGQIVDVETGQPIAGAAVLVVWWEAVFNPIQGAERFYDAKEAVTGPDGRFEIPRLRVPFWRLGVQPGQVIIFAPGYAYHADRVTPPSGEPFVTPTIVQMRRLKTREERVDFQTRFPPSIPLDRMPIHLRALNEERRHLGFDPFVK